MALGIREIFGAVASDTFSDLLLDSGYHNACQSYFYKIGGEHTVPNSQSPDEKGSGVYYHFSSEAEIATIFNSTRFLEKGKYKYPSIINLSDNEEVHTPKYVTYNADFVVVAPVKSEWIKDEQERMLFKPIFSKIEQSFFANLKTLPYIEKDYNFPSYNKFRGYNVDLGRTMLKDAFGDNVAFVRFSDIEIKINKNLCNEYYDVILRKFNKLKDL